MDEHPMLSPPGDEFIEIGWLAAKLYVSPEHPNMVAMSWHSEGLDYFRQIGVVEEIRQTLAEAGIDIED